MIVLLLNFSGREYQFHQQTIEMSIMCLNSLYAADNFDKRALFTGN